MPAGQAATAWPRVFFGAAAFLRYRGTSRGQGDGSPPSLVLAGLDSQLLLAHLTLRPGTSRGLGALPYSALPLLCGPRSQSSAHPSGALMSGRRGCRASFCILCGARLRESILTPWEVGPGGTRSCGDLVQAWTEAGWLTGRNPVPPHRYGCKVSSGVGPLLVVWESPRAGRAVCCPQL